MHLSQDFDNDKAWAAFAWLRLAAEQRDAKAMYALGIMIEHGIDIAPDRPRALSLYREAALQALVAEFDHPPQMRFHMLPTELVHLLEHCLIFEDQRDLTQSATATRERVLEMLMCLKSGVLQAEAGGAQVH